MAELAVELYYKWRLPGEKYWLELTEDTRDRWWAVARYVDANPVYLKGDSGLGTGCCLCLNVKGERVEADVVVDGFSLCKEHNDAVIERRGLIRFTPDGRFDLVGTLHAMKLRRSERGVAT
jgi:hypothetical protein